MHQQPAKRPQACHELRSRALLKDSLFSTGRGPVQARGSGHSGRCHRSSSQQRGRRPATSCSAEKPRLLKDSLFSTSGRGPVQARGSGHSDATAPASGQCLFTSNRQRGALVTASVCVGSRAPVMLQTVHVLLRVASFAPENKHGSHKQNITGFDQVTPLPWPRPSKSVHSCTPAETRLLHILDPTKPSRRIPG